MGSRAGIARRHHGRSTPEADDVSAASFEARLIVSKQTVSAACASFTEFTMAAATCTFLPFARRGAPRRECGVFLRGSSR